MTTHGEYKAAQQAIYASARTRLAAATTDDEKCEIRRDILNQLLQAYRDWDGGDPQEPDIE